MSDPSQLRVSDADRERLIEELHEHTVAGRLTAEELEDRIGGVYRATTYADLEALHADLPVSASSVQLELSKRKSRLRRRLLQEAGGSLSPFPLSALVSGSPRAPTEASGLVG